MAREIKEFERTSTTAANAYVKPIVAAYLQELEEILGRTVIVKSDSQLHQEKFDLA